MVLNRARKRDIRAEMARSGVRHAEAKRLVDARVRDAETVASLSASMSDEWVLTPLADLDPYAPLAVNMPAGWLVAGMAGSGKSMAAWGLATASVAAGGSVTIVDLPGWDAPGMLPDGRAVEVTDLRDAPVGALSPFGMLGSVYADQSLAIEAIRSLVGYSFDHVVAVVRRVVALVSHEETPSLWRVAELLRLSPDAEVSKVGDDLANMGNFEWAHLVLPACEARIEEGPLSGVQVVTTHNSMPMPSPVGQQLSWDRPGRVGSTVAHLLTQYVTTRAVETGRPATMCVTYADVLWTSWGVSIMESFFRHSARVAKSALVLSTWSLKGIPERLESLLSERLMFRQHDHEELQAALRLLEMAPNNRWIRSQLRDLNPGACLWRHLDGQVVPTFMHASDTDKMAFAGDPHQRP